MGAAVFLAGDREKEVVVEYYHYHPVNDIPLEEEKAAFAQGADDHKWMLGYYTVYHPKDKKSLESLQRHGEYMKEVSTMTFDVTESGEIVGQPQEEGVELARSGEIAAFAALSNQKEFAFDRELAHRLLHDPMARGRAVENALALVEEHGFRGINVDFENMLPEDREVYSLFIRELSEAFHEKGYLVVVSVAAKTVDSPKSKWVGAFDYAELGRFADKVQLMTYDEHGSWGEPGAVASYPWVENVLKYATSQIPAEKVLLGLPAYGYDWNLSAGKGHHKAVAWKAMPGLLEKSGAVPQWDERMKSPFVKYRAEDGSQHVVWYENERSIRAKLDLVKRYRLGGVAMWRMGLEDESFWRAVQAGLEGDSEL